MATLNVELPSLEQIQNFFTSVYGKCNTITSGCTGMHFWMGQTVVSGLTVVEVYSETHDDKYLLVEWKFFADGTLSINYDFEWHNIIFDWLEDADEKMCNYNFHQIS